MQSTQENTIVYRRARSVRQLRYSSAKTDYRSKERSRTVTVEVIGLRIAGGVSTAKVTQITNSTGKKGMMMPKMERVFQMKDLDKMTVKDLKKSPNQKYKDYSTPFCESPEYCDYPRCTCSKSDFEAVDTRMRRNDSKR